MKLYLFRQCHNGYYSYYQPFEVSESLTQENVDKLILSIIPAARRLGSCLDHLLEALDKKNIKFKKYNSQYYKIEDLYDEKYINGLDPLPECMYKLEILNNISGNY